MMMMMYEKRTFIDTFTAIVVLDRQKTTTIALTSNIGHDQQTHGQTTRQEEGQGTITIQKKERNKIKQSFEA